MTDSQIGLGRSYGRRWIWRLFAAPLAVSFVLSGVGLLIPVLYAGRLGYTTDGVPVSPFAFVVPGLGVVVLVAWIIEEVRFAQNREALRAMAARDRVERAVRLYGRRWFWRPVLVVIGLLMVGAGVSVLLPSSNTLGNLRVDRVHCQGGDVCDVSGAFRPDGGGAEVPIVYTTVPADQRVTVGTVIRAKQTADIEVTTEVDSGPDWILALQPLVIGVIVLAQWIFIETRIGPARALARRTRAAAAKVSPAASLLDAAGGVVFRDES